MGLYEITSHLENILDPDQLALVKTADQDPHCFPLCTYVNAENWKIAF